MATLAKTVYYALTDSLSSELLSNAFRYFAAHAVLNTEYCFYYTLISNNAAMCYSFGAGNEL